MKLYERQHMTKHIPTLQKSLHEADLKNTLFEVYRPGEIDFLLLPTAKFAELQNCIHDRFSS